MGKVLFFSKHLKFYDKKSKQGSKILSISKTNYSIVLATSWNFVMVKKGEHSKEYILKKEVIEQRKGGSHHEKRIDE